MIIALFITFLVLIVLVAVNREYFTSENIKKMITHKYSLINPIKKSDIQVDNFMSGPINKSIRRKLLKQLFNSKETFANLEENATMFNIFAPKLNNDYKNLFDSYGENLYSDNVEQVNGVNTLDYLKNNHMSYLNRNIALQKYIDDTNLRLSNILNNKIEDLKLVKLAKDSKKYYTFNE